jgi:uroporphyrinogen decarboxylase
MPMTPRERILTSFSHQVPDRTPTDAWFHDEVERKLLKHYKTDCFEEVLDDLGIVGWKNKGVSLSLPEFEAAAEEGTYKQMTRRGIWKDQRTYSDPWGVTFAIGESGWYEEWLDGPLVNADGEDVSAVTSLALPGTENIVEPENYADTIQQLKDQQYFVSGGISNPYKTAWMLRGMDNVLADYLINREFLEALYDRLYALATEQCLRMTRAGVDMIKITGDIAMQDRIIMGPDTWREVDKPRMAALVAACREVNPDLYVYIHSDGNVTDLMDDLVEIGFDVINPIQPECMDPVAVKERYGDRITMHGGVSIQQTLPKGTTGEVRAEIEELIRKCGYNGGLVVFPSNVLQPDTPLENIQACFYAARDFNLASL